ncbi:MAG: toxic anion resistance protein, partial [Firmicutes bacterium]|nr:toxic anion resistance protein [Bacillota bacterium]
MVIALGIEHSRQAMEAGRLVTDMTNELLKKNSEALRQATVDVTREAERGIVDIETLTHRQLPGEIVEKIWIIVFDHDIHLHERYFAKSLEIHTLSRV